MWQKGERIMDIYRVKANDSLATIAQAVVEWIDSRIEHGIPKDCPMALERNDTDCVPYVVWSSTQIDRLNRHLGPIETDLNAGRVTDDALDFLALTVESIGLEDHYFGTSDDAPETLGLWPKATLGPARPYLGQEIPGHADNLWFQRFTMDVGDTFSELKLVRR